ncbi:MAG TPA: peptide synthetase [Micromonosporaceae bacterium]|nr:peptide synthetase [Micromonosporaceae bacterium]
MAALASGTVPALLAARAAAEPDHVALLVDGEMILTVAQWNDRANATGRGLLARGVRRGDRVVLVFGGTEWLDYAVAFAAVTSIGAVAVPLSDSLPPARIREVAEHCAASLIVDASTALRGAPTPLNISVQPSELAQIIYTSGTTGVPKGVSATHANLTHGIGRLEHSRHVLHAFPIGTNAGQTMLIGSLVARPTTIVQSRFDPDEFAALATRHAAESIFVVPAMAVALLEGGHDLPSVELIASSAAPLPPAVAQRLSCAYADAAIINTYTSTEAAPAFTTMIYDPARPDSVGRPSGDIRVSETGEVWLRSPTTPRAYFGDDAATAETFQHGWIRMGDVGYFDADGYLYLSDRDVDVVKAGAHKVSTLRVENALYEHPDVVEAAVVGLPHPVMGSTLAAAVVAREAFDLRGFLASRLAPYEVPTRLLTLEALPRNESGKVLKRRLRELFAESPVRVPPSTPAEIAVAQLWTKVLRVREVGVGDDFFALGGDSLTATRLASLLNAPTSFVFDTPVLADQAAVLPVDLGVVVGDSRDLRVSPPPQLQDRRGEGVELTATQESLLAWMYAGDEPRDAGPISVGVRVRDEFDPGRFAKALGEVVRRHESLRMVFQGKQARVLEDCEPVVTVVSAPSEAEAVQLLRADREGRFDLANGPLVRAIVVVLGPEDHLIGLAVHHLVFDGASMGVLLHELGLAYAGSPLPDPVEDYRKYVAWTRRQWPENLPYWQSTLNGAPEYLEPFTGRKHALRMRSASLCFNLGPAAPLRAIAAEHGATTFMALAAVWATVLAKAGGLTDIVLLTPVPGRSKPGSESLIGCLVQSMMLRIDTAGDPTFSELLAQVRATSLAALDHQYHPFAQFYQRHPGASFLRVESWGGQAHLPGLLSEQFDLPRALDADWPTPDGKPDLQAPELAVVEQPDGTMKAWLLWNHYAFDRSTMDAMVQMLTEHITREIQ